MKTILMLTTVVLATVAAPARAALEVFACEPEWAALAGELGGNLVNAESATTPQQDPHYIQARPSLIAKVRGVIAETPDLAGKTEVVFPNWTLACACRKTA